MAQGPILLVVGARPNFMKIAPLLRSLIHRNVPTLLLHTGQHYDENMSGVFFEDLNMRPPDIHLDVGSASHAVQTATIMIRFEEVCREHSPSMVVVVGDVNSTIACALVAKKMQIPVAHVEAGLRSGDRTMPEEINRILTDSISDLLFTPSRDGDENLIAEGVDQPDHPFRREHHDRFIVRRDTKVCRSGRGDGCPEASSIRSPDTSPTIEC